MPSLIFFAVGMWDEAYLANIASMKTARDGGQGGYHPLHWLEHGYLQLGNTGEAAKLVAIVETDLKEKQTRSARNNLAMCRATWLVETRGKELPSMLEPIEGAKHAGFEMARGLEYVRRNDIAAARHAIQRIKDAGGNAVMERMLESAVEFASGSKEAAVSKAVEAAEAEDKMIFEYGPPPMVKPAWEHAGELYLKMGRKNEALDAFQRVLRIYPNRRMANEGVEAATAHTTRTN
jgi:tetratricopeptide (TPR) repeat protein